MNLVRGSHLVFRRTGTRFGWCLHFHVIRGDVWLLGRSEGHMVSLSGPWVSLLPRGVTGALTAATPPRRPVFKNGGRMHPSAVAVSEASSVHRRLFLCWFTGRVSVLGTVGWCEGRREASLSTCKWWGHSVSPQLDFNASSPICSNRPLIRLFLKKKKKSMICQRTYKSCFICVSPCQELWLAQGINLVKVWGLAEWMTVIPPTLVIFCVLTFLSRLVYISL